MRDIVLVHYDELALKGERRRYYEDRLIWAVANALRDRGSPRPERTFGRLVFRLGERCPDASLVLDRISRVFGVRYALAGVEVEADASAIASAAEHVAAACPADSTFAVRAKRADKTFAVRSAELQRDIGARIAVARGWKVDLSNPGVVIKIEIVNGRAFVAARRVEGPGGLPYGTAGHGVALLSGGIDSPVAAWMMMSRGLRLSFVHFHSAPYTNRESQVKVRRILRVLSNWQPTIDAAFVPFATTVQQVLVERAPARWRVILYRRFMVRIAAEIASAIDASALITGDSLAQVASQTVENLATIDAASPLPIFRPLIGLGKDKIMTEARRLGTFDISIEPDQDCCSYLMPPKPATRSTPEELLAIEQSLPVAEMVAAALKGREIVTVRFDA